MGLKIWGAGWHPRRGDSRSGNNYADIPAGAKPQWSLKDARSIAKSAMHAACWVRFFLTQLRLQGLCLPPSKGETFSSTISMR